MTGSGICAPKTPSEMAPPANVAPVSAPRELPAADEPQPAPSVDAQLAPAVPYDIMLGVTGDSPQYGLLGDVSGRRVAIDLNQTHTVSLFGVQGGGKSYTLGTIAEMASGDAARHHQLDLAGAAPDLLAAGAADLSDATQTALSPA
jgi:hypothetical protein